MHEPERWPAFTPFGAVVAWSEGDFRAMRNMVHLGQSDLS